MTTLIDIAKLCNVSKSTVSRVLNNDPDFSVADSTREQIIHTAISLNYDMHKQRKLPKMEVISTSFSSKSITSLKIGILNYSLQLSQNNEDYYNRIITSMISVLKNMNLPYNFEFQYIFQDSYEELNNLDGLIIVGKLNLNPHHPAVSAIKYKMIVDYTAPDHDFDSVHINFFDVVNTAIRRFNSLGITDISYIGGIDHITQFAKSERSKTSEVRQNAFIAYCLQNGFSIDDHVWTTDSFISEEGYNATKRIITEGKIPQAILYGSDELALGGYKAFQEHNIKIGKDISIISIDDAPFASFLTPPLTSISLNVPLIGETAARAFASQLNGRNYSLVLNPPIKLIDRKSCIPPATLPSYCGSNQTP